MAQWLSERIFIREMNGKPNIFVPQIVHLKNKEIVDRQRSLYDKDARDDLGPLAFNEEARNRLLERYITIFNRVKKQKS